MLRSLISFAYASLASQALSNFVQWKLGKEPLRFDIEKITGLSIAELEATFASVLPGSPEE